MLFEFKKNSIDQCIYLKVSWSNVIILVLYDDDILLATYDLALLFKTKMFISNNFEMKDMGDTFYVIEIEILDDKSYELLSCLWKHISIGY